jgi:SAM-dependent methyltransferase
MVDTIRQHIPTPVRSLLREVRGKWRTIGQRRKFEKMGVQRAFSEIYRLELWGKGLGSGLGSTEQYSSAYCEFVLAFCREKGIQTVVDIGCGDFRVGSLIARTGQVEYIGIDVVPALIEEHQRTVVLPKASFCCMNAIMERPPTGDLCLIRQVLQHLSNSEIKSLLDNCRHYRYILVTEHVLPGGDVIPNLDKPHGPDIRSLDNSAVYLHHPPFSMAVKIVFDTPYLESEFLRTYLIEQTDGT